MFNTMHPYGKDIYSNLDLGKFEVHHRNMQEKMLENIIIKDQNAAFCDNATCIQESSHLPILIARSVTSYGLLQSFAVNYLFKPMVIMLLFVIFLFSDYVTFYMLRPTVIRLVN